MNQSNDPARFHRPPAARALAGFLALVLMPATTAVASPDFGVAPHVQGTPATTPFTGRWIGHDPAPPDGDGSWVHLVVKGGLNPAIEFTDDFGSVCVNVGSPVTEFTSRLTGRVDGSTLDATFKNARCGSVVLQFLLGASLSLQLDDGGNDDPSDDMLFDGSVLWSRA